MVHESVCSLIRKSTASPLATGAKRCIASAVAAVAIGALPSAALADIELGEGLSVAGFVDMSVFHWDPEGGSSDTSFGVDQVETQFMYAGSNGVSAQVDIEYNDVDGTFVEQAFITKQFTDQFSVKAGRFLSYSGWETEEPTGLYQYSGTGYAPYFYGYYQQGVSAAYTTEKFGLMASVVNSAFDPLDRDSSKPGYELGASITPIEGFTAKAFYIVNKYDGVSGDDELINLWASYSTGPFTFAAEYNTADYANGGDGDGFLLMANYATGPWGFTVRYHDYEIEDALGFTAVENSGFTFSPSYKVGDHLLLVAEYRRDDFGPAGDANSLAFELLFTF